jgi:hypothetical protein
MHAEEPAQRLAAAYQPLHDLQAAIDREIERGSEPSRCENCGCQVFAGIRRRWPTLCGTCRDKIAEALIAELEAEPVAPIPPSPSRRRMIIWSAVGNWCLLLAALFALVMIVLGIEGMLA